MNRKQAPLSVDTLRLLKVKILKSAIEGKLVPQLDEEPEVEQIGEVPEELSFDIPGKWKWVRSTELVSLIRGVTFPRSAKQVSNIDSSYVRCLTTGSVQEEYKRSSDVFIPSVYIKNGKQRLKKGDVVISSANSRDLVGKSILWNGPDDTFGGFLTVARVENKLISPDYLHLVFRFFFLSGFFKTLATQTTNIANLSNKIFETLFFPLPPLGEQKRIVEKVESLFPEVDAVQKSMDGVSQLVGFLEKRLLHSAINGKLVPQLDEEPEVEKIGEAPEEVPFDIPKKWKWQELKTVCSDFLVPMRDKPSFTDDPEGIDWCRIEDIQGRFLNGSLSGRRVSKETIKSMNLKVDPIGTVISACSGASIGAAAIVTKPCCTNQTFIGLVPSEELQKEYLYYFLLAIKEHLWKIGTGTTLKYISRKKYENLLIPLPPVEEQKRIVAKLDKLMLEIQKLK